MVVRTVLGSVLSWCYSFARFHDIDLAWHIEHKMEYNTHRAALHGKQY